MCKPPPLFAESNRTDKKFPWGCVLGGCATVLALLVIGVSISLYAGYRYLQGQIDAYTSLQPAEIPVVEYSKEEIADTKKRIDDFRVALEKGEDQESLVLTSEDINAMISAEEELAGRLFVNIQDGEITGEASFPADAIPLGQGRYFNGSVSLKASLDNGVLIVTLDKAAVNGKPIPEEFMKELRDKNLAADAYSDPKSAEFLRKFESLTIENDTIILTPAKRKSRDSTSPPAATSTGASDSDSANSQAEISTPTEFQPSSND